MSALAQRAFAFLRSVCPADPAHILILLGATFLFITPDLRWWPTSVLDLRWFTDMAGEGRAFTMWVVSVKLMTLPALVAGAAAGYLCLLEVRKPLRALVRAVLLPAVVTLVAVPAAGFIWFADVLLHNGGVVESVIDANNRFGATIPQLLRNLGPGLPIAAAGFVLVAIFGALLRTGRSALPLRLRFSGPFFTGSTGDDLAADDQRTGLFIWTMICLVPLANLLQSVLLGLFSLIPPFVASVEALRWTDRILGALSLLALVVVAMGKDRVTALRHSLRAGLPEYVGIGMLIPVGLACAWPLLRFFLDVNHRMVGFGGDSPKLGDYVNLPSPILLWLLVPAFVEEIAWRGYLQLRLVRRYGLVRGIFLVGIVWGAFHFAGDFNARMTAAGVVVHIAERLTETVAQSYVLGWLTIRSRSILPAAVAHAIFNISVSHGFSNGTAYGSTWIMALAWASLGYVLFRYFPAPAVNEDAFGGGTPNFEAAT